MLKAHIVWKVSMKHILVTNIKWENPQPMQHVVILIQVGMHLCQPEDVCL